MTDPIAEAKQAERVAERAEIVAWLRAQITQGEAACSAAPDRSRKQRDYAAGVVVLRNATEAIERGDHATLDARSREDGDTRRQGEGRG